MILNMKINCWARVITFLCSFHANEKTDEPISETSLVVNRDQMKSQLESVIVEDMSKIIDIKSETSLLMGSDQKQPPFESDKLEDSSQKSELKVPFQPDEKIDNVNQSYTFEQESFSALPENLEDIQINIKDNEINQKNKTEKSKKIKKKKKKKEKLPTKKA